MNGTQLARILRFAQQTHDKVIVTDVEGKEPMVVMPFDMYEHLIDVGRAAAGFDTDGQKAPEPVEPTTSHSPFVKATGDVPALTPVEPPKDQKSQEFLGEEEQFYLEPVE